MVTHYPQGHLRFKRKVDLGGGEVHNTYVVVTAHGERKKEGGPIPGTHLSAPLWGAGCNAKNLDPSKSLSAHSCGVQAQQTRNQLLPPPLSSPPAPHNGNYSTPKTQEPVLETGCPSEQQRKKAPEPDGQRHHRSELVSPSIPGCDDHNQGPGRRRHVCIPVPTLCTCNTRAVRKDDAFSPGLQW